MSKTLNIGATYSVSYPFVRELVDLPPDDPEGAYPNKVKTWRPGCAFDRDDGPYGVGDWYADGIGEMLLTVVSVHKPANYPERVFYIRQWRDPDGHVFGKKNLRVIAQSAFKGLLRGFRHDYIYEPDEASA